MAQRAGSAIAELRFALKNATAEERASIEQTLRGMLGLGDAQVVAAPTRRIGVPTAAEIVAAARAVLANGGGFGWEKAFISEVHVRLNSSMELPAFKALLVKLLQAGEVRICRADLVEAMDEATVAASETRHLGATFHFVIVD